MPIRLVRWCVTTRPKEITAISSDADRLRLQVGPNLQVGPPDRSAARASTYRRTIVSMSRIATDS